MQSVIKSVIVISKPEGQNKGWNKDQIINQPKIKNKQQILWFPKAGKMNLKMKQLLVKQSLN